MYKSLTAFDLQLVRRGIGPKALKFGDKIHGAITEALDPNPAKRPQDTHKYLEKFKTLTENLKKELDL